MEQTVCSIFVLRTAMDNYELQRLDDSDQNIGAYIGRPTNINKHDT